MVKPISKPSQKICDVDGVIASELERQDRIRKAFRCLSTEANWSDWIRFGPVGWRFNPSDKELLDHYLRIKKYGGGSICTGIFGDFDLYQYDPENIPQDKVLRHNNGRMYIFTPIHKLHMNGSRKGKRDTPKGHWKMNASPTPIIENSDGLAIGTKSSLAFFDKNKGKTHWLMYEFRLVDPVYATTVQTNGKQKENEVMLDQCVLAVVYIAKEDRLDNGTTKSRCPNNYGAHTKGFEEFSSRPKPYSSQVLEEDETENYSMEQSDKLKPKYSLHIGGASTSNRNSITNSFVD